MYVCVQHVLLSFDLNRWISSITGTLFLNTWPSCGSSLRWNGDCVWIVKSSRANFVMDLLVRS